MGKRRRRARAVLACALLGAAACHAPSYIDGEGDSNDDQPLPERSAGSDVADAAAPIRTTTSPLDAGGSDAAPEGSVDASATETFSVGNGDCNGGHCKGGYGGAKDVTLLPTATEQCVVRAFTHALDFTIGGQPGGKFCVFKSGKYSCDSSCDGCNTMQTITCAKP